MGLIVASGGGAAAAGLCALAGLAWPAAGGLAGTLGWLTLVTGLPLLALFAAGAGNESPGAIDNASGAGLVMHLAEVAAAGPLADLPVTVLVAGAEELGVVGARAFVMAAQRAGWLPRQAGAGDLYVLNFDGVGGGGRLTLAGRAGELADRVEAACRALRLPLGRLRLGGALFDHGPFAEVGVEAVSLMVQGPAALRVHTPGDRAERLVDEGFRQAGETALKVLAGLRG
jgi:Zn-dependent M28 family amino/carboxypeptidase